jgi:hypothetical protein
LARGNASLGTRPTPLSAAPTLSAIRKDEAGIISSRKCSIILGDAKESITTHELSPIPPKHVAWNLRLFAKQQKIMLPHLADCTGSLPNFVSQHAAKKPV